MRLLREGGRHIGDAVVTLILLVLHVIGREDVVFIGEQSLNVDILDHDIEKILGLLCRGLQAVDGTGLTGVDDYNTVDHTLLR